MKRRISVLLAAVAMAAAFVFPAAVSAHNRGLVWLPNGGGCVQVGSLKSVWVPGKDAYLDLYPQDGPYPLDEYGTSFAAGRGNSALEKGACPVSINGR